MFYLCFAGPAEEILFRGYIQSGLNQLFGKPFRFFGVAWGCGALGAALLFGLMHVINLASLYRGQVDLQLVWGLWTFFGGLVFSFVREKTGGVLAPTILHRFPQAMAYPYWVLDYLSSTPTGKLAAESPAGDQRARSRRPPCGDRWVGGRHDA